MAQQDKTDFYWNGVLSGAVNNLYYDLINVDVCHVPYTTTHRNSSFFLKTRPSYVIAKAWADWSDTNGYIPTDIKIIRDEKCNQEEWTVYVLWKKWKNKAIFAASISDWCVGTFFNCTNWCTPSTEWDIYDECPDVTSENECGDWKLFTTNYVRWMRYDWVQLATKIWNVTVDNIWVTTWIQINRYNLWTTIGLFSDEYVDSWDYKFTPTMYKSGNYLLVYASENWEEDGFSWQVRMITWMDEEWRVMVNAPWSWFKVVDTSTLAEWEFKEQYWYHVSYAVFTDWWEVIWFTASNKIYLLPFSGDCEAVSPYNQKWGTSETNIIWVAEANDKIFVLTDNWYIHYCSANQYWGYDKFFIQDDMFAWVDKTSIVAYRDFILAFGRKHIAVWVPDEQNRYRTMYNQSTTIWTWSRYSYAEYDWDLLFVSNDKRLLALWVSSTAGRYMLQHEDVWDMINGKLASLTPWDEVFIWNDKNNLRVFVQTKSTPYVTSWYIDQANLNVDWANTMTHIHKFDSLFKVWTEDHVGFLASWAEEWIYYWEWGLYIRRKYFDDKQVDIYKSGTSLPFVSRINAYLIENENTWLEWKPTLFQLAKLNRLITTLWPWIYSNNTRIKITVYSKWIGYTYESPVSGDWNDWLWLVTSYYMWETLDDEDERRLECIVSSLQDSLKKYQPTCTDSKVHYQSAVQTKPRCENYEEMLIQDHWVCINDTLYEMAPTMPLVTSLWENQDYATQIKIELISEWGDYISFGWRLAEMYIAPLFLTWPDWEYQLQPNTDC